MGLAVQRVDAVHALGGQRPAALGHCGNGALLLRQRASAAFWACAVVGTGLVLAFAAWKGGARLQLADGLLALAVLSAAIGYVQGAAGPGGPGVASMPSEEVICWVLVMSMLITVPVAGGCGQRPRRTAERSAHYLVSSATWRCSDVGFARYRGLALVACCR